MELNISEEKDVMGKRTWRRTMLNCLRQNTNDTAAQQHPKTNMTVWIEKERGINDTAAQQNPITTIQLQENTNSSINNYICFTFTFNLKITLSWLSLWHHFQRIVKLQVLYFSVSKMSCLLAKHVDHNKPLLCSNTWVLLSLILFYALWEKLNKFF